MLTVTLITKTSYRVYSIVSKLRSYEAHHRFSYSPLPLSLTVGGESHRAQLQLAFAAQ